jgi:integrating conjugative element protein (TIGR03759 family)
MASQGLKALLFVCVITITTQALAISAWKMGYGSEREDPNSNYRKRTAVALTDGLSKDQDVDKVTLTAAQKHQALVWSLSHQEEKRYVLLMQNKAGVFYAGKHLSPLEILGINATNNASRRDFALRQAKAESEHIAKLLAYVTAESEAMKELNQGLPNVLPFDVSKYDPNRYEPAAFKSGDQVMMWTTSKDKESSIIIRYLITQIKKIPNLRVNVYFTGKDVKKSDIQTWAKHNSIPRHLVANKKITLNFNNGQYNQDSLGLFVMRDGLSTQLDISRF